MSAICANCGKTSVYGSSQRHRRGVAGKRWNKRAQETKRVFNVNFQIFEGKKLCSSCLKKIKSKK